MKKFCAVLSMILLLTMSTGVYAADIFETGNWRMTSGQSDGIRLGVRSMTEEEKVAFQQQHRESEEAFQKLIDETEKATHRQQRESEGISLFDIEPSIWRETGELSNGVRWGVRSMTEGEKAAFKCREEAGESEIITPFSYSWSGKVNVPITKSAGANGKQLGSPFIIAPHSYASIHVGSLPSNMPTVNIGVEFTNGMDRDWIPNLGSNEVVEIDPGSYNNYEMVAKVSTIYNRYP